MRGESHGLRGDLEAARRKGGWEPTIKPPAKIEPIRRENMRELGRQINMGAEVQGWAELAAQAAEKNPNSDFVRMIDNSLAEIERLIRENKQYNLPSSIAEMSTSSIVSGIKELGIGAFEKKFGQKIISDVIKGGIEKLIKRSMDFRNSRTRAEDYDRTGDTRRANDQMAKKYEDEIQLLSNALNELSQVNDTHNSEPKAVA